MKKQIMFLMVLFVVGMVSAISMPHAFYGEVYYSDGVLIQEELTITANIDDVEEVVVLENGVYDLVVESEDDATVYFYIEGLTESIGSYTFESFAVTELDFTTTLSNPSSQSSSSSSSGGSSGGGGSSSSLNTYEEYEKVSEEDNLQDLETQQISSGITGSAIGVSDFNKVLGIGGGVLVLILLTILLVILKSRKH